MSADLYSEWLGIPEGERPPDHYALLGLPRFCSDVDEIERAARDRIRKLDRYRIHPRRSKRHACNSLMNEVAQARMVLVDAEQRSLYDKQLRAATPSLADETSVSPPSGGPTELHTSATQRKWLGIRLGEANCSIACIDAAGHITPVPNAEGEMSTPSAILFDPSRRVIVGREAKAAMRDHPELVADGIARDMGQKYYRRRINGKRVSPIQLSAVLLRKLMRDAEESVGPIEGAVITVPPHFDEACRESTLTAGQVARIPVIAVLKEPAAAVLAHAIQEGAAENIRPGTLVNLQHRFYVVCNLEEDALELTLVTAQEHIPSVLATDREESLGSQAWDDKLADHAAAEFKTTHGIDLLTKAGVYHTLQHAAAQTRIELVSKATTHLSVSHGDHKLDVEITRELFEHMTAFLLSLASAQLSGLLEDAKVATDDIGAVIALGHCSSIPAFMTMIERAIGKKPNCPTQQGEPVACGAAIHAATYAPSRVIPPRPALEQGMVLPSDTSLSPHRPETIGDSPQVTDTKSDWDYELAPEPNPFPVSKLPPLVPKPMRKPGPRPLDWSPTWQQLLGQIFSLRWVQALIVVLILFGGFALWMRTLENARRIGAEIAEKMPTSPVPANPERRSGEKAHEHTEGRTRPTPITRVPRRSAVFSGADHDKQLNCDLDSVEEMRFSPDASLLAIRGTKDSRQALTVRDISTGATVGTTKNTTSEDAVLLFLPESRTVLCGTRQGEIRRLDLATGLEIVRYPGCKHAPSLLAVNNDESLLAAVDGSRVLLFALQNARVLSTIPEAGEPVVALCFNADGTLLAVGTCGRSRSCTVAIWNVPEANRTNLRTATPARTMRVAAGRALDLVFSDDPPTLLAVASQPRCSGISWNSQTEVQSECEMPNANCVLCTLSSRRMVTHDVDTTTPVIRVYNLTDGLYRQISYSECDPSAVALSSDGTCMALAYPRGQVHTYRLPPVPPSSRQLPSNRTVVASPRRPVETPKELLAGRSDGSGQSSILAQAKPGHFQFVDPLLQFELRGNSARLGGGPNLRRRSGRPYPGPVPVSGSELPFYLTDTGLRPEQVSEVMWSLQHSGWILAVEFQGPVPEAIQGSTSGQYRGVDFYRRQARVLALPRPQLLLMSSDWDLIVAALDLVVSQRTPLDLAAEKGAPPIIGECVFGGRVTQLEAMDRPGELKRTLGSCPLAAAAYHLIAYVLGNDLAADGDSFVLVNDGSLTRIGLQPKDATKVNALSAACRNRLATAADRSGEIAVTGRADAAEYQVRTLMTAVGRGQVSSNSSSVVIAIPLGTRDFTLLDADAAQKMLAPPARADKVLQVLKLLPKRCQSSLPLGVNGRDAQVFQISLQRSFASNPTFADAVVDAARSTTVQQFIIVLSGPSRLSIKTVQSVMGGPPVSTGEQAGWSRLGDKLLFQPYGGNRAGTSLSCTWHDYDCIQFGTFGGDAVLAIMVSTERFNRALGSKDVAGAARPIE